MYVVPPPRTTRCHQAAHSIRCPPPRPDLVFKNAIPKKLVAELVSEINSKMAGITKKEMKKIIANTRPNAIDFAVSGRPAIDSDGQGRAPSVDWHSLERDPVAGLARLSPGDRYFARLLLQGQGLAIAKGLYGGAEQLAGSAEPHIAYRYTDAALAKKWGYTGGSTEARLWTLQGELRSTLEQVRPLAT